MIFYMRIQDLLSNLIIQKTKNNSKTKTVMTSYTFQTGRYIICIVKTAQHTHYIFAIVITIMNILIYK